LQLIFALNNYFLGLKTDDFGINKKAAAFGCYGWSGESVRILKVLMEKAGFEIIDEEFENLWNPYEGQQKSAFEYDNIYVLDVLIS